MKNILGFFALLILASSSFAQILHIGDSLTVGPFGQSLNGFYSTEYGKSNKTVYGSCGASPESYLAGYKVYYSLCGYRKDELVKEPSNRGVKNLPTPKIEELIKTIHPKFVVVQLGTNWMDGFAQSRDTIIINKLVSTIQASGAKIIWITPPDSSHYSKAVQDGVKRVIIQASKQYSFPIIDSTKFTHYTRASGGDGIHYGGKEGKSWASKVIPLIRNELK